ncbi:Galactose-binding domain-like protein [Purpureocillium lavendulum]|uniref:Galactose-binding domain-like protein n=1 Tax=Purpureocillium lavendulum TaxID=1247861 RepID=A0AB34FLK1_9HYPO|nr:Galactose-binding domain-like protein [Purpureocillium lavendulum]
MDHSMATEMGQFIGMPVTSTVDASTYIITNYNGVGRRKDKADYHALQPKSGINRVPLWQFLRGCTAAPLYFTPQYIQGIGYQDGGLTYNNPASIAIDEAAALFPSMPKPSIVLSLGTGFAKQSPTRPSRIRRVVGDPFVARLLRAFMKQGDSDRAWRQMLSHRSIGESGELFRFDIEYDDNGPSLDNIRDIEYLGTTAKKSIRNSPELIRLAHCIRAELFYFELEGKPRLVNGVYECVGALLCRLAPGTEGFRALMDRLDGVLATLQIGTRVVTAGFRNRTSHADGFRKQISFHVSARLTPFSITLCEGPAGECHISGSPFTLDGLIKAQRLDAGFGTADHRDVQAMHHIPGNERKEGQFWNDLCNLRQDWGMRKFVLLCAVPARVKLRDNDAERQQMLRCISEQLAHHGSQLHTDLESAADFCEKLLQNSLPEERLMIENYSSKYFPEGMQTSDYQAFVYDKALEQLMDKFQSGAALPVAENVQCSGTFEHIFELAQLEEDSRHSLRKLQDEVNKLKAERRNLNCQVQEEGEKLRIVIEKVAHHQQYLDEACLDRVVPQKQYDGAKELFE